MLSSSGANRYVHDDSPLFCARIRPGYTSTVVHLSGELDIASSSKVWSALVLAVDLRAPTTVVDLSPVTFIDAYVLGLIISARRSAINRGATLGVSGAEGHIAELFAVLGLEGLVLTADAGDPEEDGHGRR